MQRSLRITAGVLCVLLLTPCVRDACAGPSTAHPYDAYFRKYTKRFFGVGFDWRFFKAQGLVESGLNADAVSRAGAKGVMQLLPSTFRAVQVRNPDLGDIGDPQWNIAAGISYARRLWLLWQGDVETAHLREFTLGSYNAGRATLLRAQRMAESMRLNQRIWPSIEMVAPAVPGWQYQETVNYVLRVFMYLGEMDSKGRLPSR
jgi:membrane-bound lytic murein transglycosylase MltF